MPDGDELLTSSFVQDLPKPNLWGHPLISVFLVRTGNAKVDTNMFLLLYSCNAGCQSVGLVLKVALQALYSLSRYEHEELGLHSSFGTGCQGT